MSVKQVASQVAPRLHYRRLIHIYFFPWVLCACTFLLAAISLYLGVTWWVVLLIWAILVASFILKDLTSPYSIITRYYYKVAEMLHYNIREGIKLEEETIVYLNYSYPPLFPYRSQTRWVLYLFILFILTLFAAYQSQSDVAASASDAAVATFLILLYSLLIYSRFISLPVDLSQPYRVAVWVVVLAWFTAVAFYCLNNLLHDLRYAFAGAILILLIMLSLFAMLRLWADSYSFMAVLDGLTRDLLSWPQRHHELNGAAVRIGHELRHDRVFILTINEERSDLVIEDQYGVQKSIYGHAIPLMGSICGRAFREKRDILWNDVRLCPYFHTLAEDNTAAEIAVPITYRDEIFGILDVQSTRPNVFGPTDLRALQTAAQALGAALAASRSNTFFDEALNLWKKIDDMASTPFTTEEQAFELFADFARERLHADLVIYFPLSLSDCPTRLPYTRGEFNDEKPIHPPVNDPTSSLVRLIHKWEPLFEELVTADSLMARSTTKDGASFVDREGIQSMCFLPVGMRSERSGALFLNFRQPRQFDRAFQFTCLSLAQSLAKATAQIRYRDVLYNSFGRPEINLHNILGRHGLKEGILQRATTQWQSQETSHCSSLESCPLHRILQDAERFLAEISLAESAIPPNFWQENLDVRLRQYVSSLPPQPSGRRPQIDRKIDARIEKENAWVKLAFYRVITEAVNNAVLHGKATEVHIQAKRDMGTLSLCIENNGFPLSPQASNKASSNGIYRLLEEVKDKFGADEARIYPHESGMGTVVSVVMPVIPW
jgi:GAF domain-containing protein